MNVIRQYISVAALLLLLFTACSPEDRSGEQPFAPTVQTLEAIVDGDSLLLIGEVTASPNSRLLGRGFNFGNDRLRLQAASPDTAGTLFRAYSRRLNPGTYFFSAYARNGIGTSYGDTLYVEIK